ncbi:HesA/MoeB/ThiF family protein [Caldimonas brevitalea]|uniref:HesA/MoeB/ThiF family protein n=1 Tax=Caldimonas brevitalea TaxID=413882 RepID=UPI0009FA7789|nr:ThiF family adenylyltransferase [Caldimonas brevitalea]
MAKDSLDRNSLWQTPNLYDRIATARVVVGGVGGIGWLIGTALIGLGVRRLELFDPDELSVANFNRLWGCGRHQVGQPKARIFADLAKGLNPEIEIKFHIETIPSPTFERALADADVVFGGYDAAEPRLATQLLALANNVMFIDAGVAIEANDDGFLGFGQVFVSEGKHSACIVCAGLRADSIGYRGDGPEPQPSSGVLNGMVANTAVSLWMQHLLGQEVPPMTSFNWNNLTLQPQKAIQRRQHCPICGPAPTSMKPVEREYAEP